MADSTIIQLNVGGRHYQSTLHTLTKEADSRLTELLLAPRAPRDAKGRYLIDSEGRLFRYILLFLQHNALPPWHSAEAVHKVAEDFRLTELKKSLEERYPFLAVRMFQDQMMFINMPEATEHINQIMQAALTIGSSPPTNNPMCLYGSVRSAEDYGNLAVDPNHRCTIVWPSPIPGCASPVYELVDFMLGPRGIYVDPRLYIFQLCQVMKSKGYILRIYEQGDNSIPCMDSQGDPTPTPCTECGSHLFRLELTWM